MVVGAIVWFWDVGLIGGFVSVVWLMDRENQWLVRIVVQMSLCGVVWIRPFAVVVTYFAVVWTCSRFAFVLGGGTLFVEISSKGQFDCD